MIHAGSAAPVFRKAMLAGALYAIDDPDVSVVSGYPWPQITQDIVSIGDVVSTVTDPTFGNRTQQENLDIEVMIYSFRQGAQDMDEVVHDRAYELLGKIEFYLRRTNTHLVNLLDDVDGNVVEWCYRTGHRFASSPFENPNTADGRVAEIAATFTALARITA